MNPMSPLSFAAMPPAANVCAVVEPGFTLGIGRFDGPPGLEPPAVTLILRAVGFVATQLRKNAAQLACAALAAIPYVSGADIAACGPPAFSGGIRKNPTFFASLVSKLPDSQSPSKISSACPASKLLIISG